MCSCVGGTTGERSSSGLLEWESVNDAMEALALINHFQMKNPSKYSAYNVTTIVMAATRFCTGASYF